MAKKSLTTLNNTSILYPTGFGYGTGSISVKKQLADGGLSYGSLIVGSEIIENDPRVFKKVDAEAKDDGCGDGREARIIYSVKNGKKVAYKRSLLRAKIFGGGLVVFTSMMRSSVWGKNLGKSTILDDRKKAAEILKQHKIAHGGHTDNHAKDDNCGCGAIDKYPDITVTALAFRSEIEAVLKQVFGEDYAHYKKAVSDVFEVYEAEAKDKKHYFADAAGAKTRELLEECSAVIKELADDHLEDFVIINDVEGETFDQRIFDTILHDRDVESTAQAFVVDLWRGRMYAKFTAKIAAENGMDKDLVFKKAMVDFLVRTLATAGTLTSGDQPVFYRSTTAKSRNFFLFKRFKIASRK